jgi:hypothetical protein
METLVPACSPSEQELRPARVPYRLGAGGYLKYLPPCPRRAVTMCPLAAWLPALATFSRGHQGGHDMRIRGAPGTSGSPFQAESHSRERF